MNGIASKVNQIYLHMLERAFSLLAGRRAIEDLGGDQKRAKDEREDSLGSSSKGIDNGFI